MTSTSESQTASLLALVPPEHVNQILLSQRNMLARFEKTNEMLVNCNSLAAVRLERATRDLKVHVQTLDDLRRDLTLIFKRIRQLKNRLKQSHPEAFQACTLPSQSSLDEDEEEEKPNLRSTGDNDS